MTEFVAKLSRQPNYSLGSLGAFALGTLLALAIASYGIAFPVMLPNIADSFHQRYLDMSMALISLHVVGGGIALLIAPFQFMIYRRNRTLHRYLGRLYFLAIMLASIGGYYMAWHAFGGIISVTGLGLLATLWWTFTLAAVIHARRGDYAAHRRWIIRSFALTFAAVTLRLMNPVLAMLFDPLIQFRIVYWLSWLANLAIAEGWIRWSERRIAAGTSP